MARDEKAREKRVDRRTYLKLAGVGAASVAATGGVPRASAASNDGYGDSGYGATAYGGTAGSPPNVNAMGATSVGSDEATLGGSLVDLGGAESAKVYFEYRPAGASGWTATTVQRRSSTRTFYQTVTGLRADTNYEFRAVAKASDGESATSDAATFATETGWRTLVVDGSSAPNITSTYSFAVDGDLEKSSSLGSIQPNDVIDGTSAEGEVVGGKDAYRFTGSITRFDAFGSPTVLLDGQEVDPTTLGDQPALPNTLVVDGTYEPRAKSTYAIEVSGELEKSGSLASIQSNDVIDGSSVEGQVVGGKDAYRYSGEVTRVEVSGPAVLQFDDNDG